MRMRIAIAAALLLMLLLAVPGGAPAAQPPPEWPTVQDIQKNPGVLARDAACIARYYHGRLSRTAWLKPYWDLSPAEKLATDAGPEHCMTPAQRIAESTRFFNMIAGDVPEVGCVARRSAALTRAQCLAITSRARWHRAYEAIFRACRLTGAVYQEVAAAKLHLPMTAAERTCANRIGNAEVMMYKSALPKKTLETIVGTIYDRCIGPKSEQAMYRYVYRAYKLPAKIPCIARRLARDLTVVQFLTDAASVAAGGRRAVAACLR
jgi:hypothetical protein